MTEPPRLDMTHLPDLAATTGRVGPVRTRIGPWCAYHIARPHTGLAFQVTFGFISIMAMNSS